MGNTRSSRWSILWHIPIYLLAICGFIVICLLISLPKGDRSEINIRDGNIEYTELDYGLTIGDIVDSINLKSEEKPTVLREFIERDDSPKQSGIWIYISPEKTRPNVILFHDIVYMCPVCHRDDIFDLCRINLVYDLNLRKFRERGYFWRESIKLSDYLIPASEIDSKNNTDARAIYVIDENF